MSTVDPSPARLSIYEAASANRWRTLALIAVFTALVAVVAFLGGIQLVVLAAVGIYIAGIFDEVKQRPLYVVREQHGVGATHTSREGVDEQAGVTS